MKKLYSALFLIFFLSCVNNNSGDLAANSSFDTNNQMREVGKNELLYQLNELPEEEFKSSLPEIKTPSLPADSLLEFTEVTNFLEESNLQTGKSAKTDSQLINPAKKTTKQETAKLNKTAETDKNGKKTDKSQNSLGQAKKLYLNGEFLTLAKTRFKKQEYESLYYQALANYNYLRKNKKYQGKVNNRNLREEKTGLIKAAKENLYAVSRNTQDDKLKERAVLWYGIMTLSYPNNSQDVKELTRAFTFIEEKMKNSTVYNDAMIYLTLIYKKLGKTDLAKEYYSKAVKTSPDDMVYNYKTDSLMPAKRLWKFFDDLK